MNINVDRYFKSTQIEAFSNRLHKFPDNKIGHILFHYQGKFRTFIITGFKYIKDENIKGGKTWNDNYHLLSKLCRYETWDNVKITWWDKIRFKIVTGYKFE